MEIQLRNLQSIPVPEDLLVQAARTTLDMRGTQLGSLSIVLTDDSRITELNYEYLGRGHPTDVIAFRVDSDTAEVFISVETARRQSIEQGHDLTTELCFLVAHGVLHVCGMDDARPDERRQMLRLQEQVLQRLQLDKYRLGCEQ